MTNNDKELCLQVKHSYREIKEAVNFEKMKSFEEIERKREKNKKIKVNFQEKFLINKACKLSYEKMQYIPLTKNELTSLNIHNVNDYVHFLNDFLMSEVMYFSYSQSTILTIRQIARPPQQLLNEINKSLFVYLDEKPDKPIRFNNVFKIFEAR
jgi:hypothetical protein